MMATSTKNDPNRLTYHQREAREQAAQVVRLHRLLTEARGIVEDLAQCPLPAQYSAWEEDDWDEIEEWLWPTEYLLRTWAEKLAAKAPAHIRDRMIQ